MNATPAPKDKLARAAQSLRKHLDDEDAGNDEVRDAAISFLAAYEAAKLKADIRKDTKAAPREIWVLVQEGGSTGEVYVHAHDSKASAKRHAKSCEKAAYNVLAIERIKP